MLKSSFAVHKLRLLSENAAVHRREVCSGTFRASLEECNSTNKHMRLLFQLTCVGAVRQTCCLCVRCWKAPRRGPSLLQQRYIPLFPRADGTEVYLCAELGFTWLKAEKVLWMKILLSNVSLHVQEKHVWRWRILTFDSKNVVTTLKHRGAIYCFKSIGELPPNSKVSSLD